MKIARVYLRVSSKQQDLHRQEIIEQKARLADYYIAGVYREKASGARSDRPELLRMIDDLQAGEVGVKPGSPPNVSLSSVSLVVKGFQSCRTFNQPAL